MNYTDMRAELAAVLADARFRKSPVLSRLLEYLVETTIRGEGAALKSYSIAVEGLGRDPDFDLISDTYPRALVVRLRRTLEIYYATTGAHRPHQLVIKNGVYEVQLIAKAAIDPKDGGKAPLPHAQRRLKTSTIATLAIVTMIFVAINIYYKR